MIGVGLVAFVLLRLQLKRWREPLFLAVAVIGEVTIFVSTTLLVDRDRPPVPHLDPRRRRRASRPGTPLPRSRCTAGWR